MPDQHKVTLLVTFETTFYTNLEFEELDEDLVEKALAEKSRLIGWERIDREEE